MQIYEIILAPQLFFYKISCCIYNNGQNKW